MVLSGEWTGVTDPHGRKSARILLRQAGACASWVKQCRSHVHTLGPRLNLFWAPAQLAVLAKVVDLNGFSAAARCLGVPKAAVSRAVADLEKALGVRVLERTTRRISLTPAGQLVYPHAKRVVEELDAAQVLIAKLQNPATGSLARCRRCDLRPCAARAAGAALPRKLSRCTAGRDAAFARRRRGRGMSRSAADSPPMNLSRIACSAHLPAVLCATPQYLAQRGMPTKPEDLRQHDLFTPESERPDLFQLEFSRNSQRAEVRVVPRLTVNDPAVLHASAAAGLGIGLLPEFLCRQGLATGRLKQVLADWSLPPAASLYAVYPATLGADPRVQRFVDFLAANIVPALAHA